MRSIFGEEGPEFPARGDRDWIALDDEQLKVVVSYVFHSLQGVISICHEEHAFFYGRLLGTIGLGVLGRDLDPLDSCLCTHSFTCRACLCRSVQRRVQ